MKAVQVLRIALPPSSDRPSTTVASTISSDGKIHIYDLAELPATCDERHHLNPVAAYDTKGTRLTCLALADGEASTSSVTTNGKRKRSEDDGAEDSEDDHEEWDAPRENGTSLDGQQEEVEDDSGSESDEE